MALLVLYLMLTSEPQLWMEALEVCNCVSGETTNARNQAIPTSHLRLGQRRRLLAMVSRVPCQVLGIQGGPGQVYCW